MAPDRKALAEAGRKKLEEFRRSKAIGAKVTPTGAAGGSSEQTPAVSEGTSKAAFATAQPTQYPASTVSVSSEQQQQGQFADNQQYQQYGYSGAQGSYTTSQTTEQQSYNNQTASAFPYTYGYQSQPNGTNSTSGYFKPSADSYTSATQYPQQAASQPTFFLAGGATTYQPTTYTQPQWSSQHTSSTANNQQTSTAPVLPTSNTSGVTAATEPAATSWSVVSHGPFATPQKAKQEAGGSTYFNYASQSSTIGDASTSNAAPSTSFPSYFPTSQTPQPEPAAVEVQPASSNTDATFFDSIQQTADARQTSPISQMHQQSYETSGAANPMPWDNTHATVATNSFAEYVQNNVNTDAHVPEDDYAGQQLASSSSTASTVPAESTTTQGSTFPPPPTTGYYAGLNSQEERPSYINAYARTIRRPTATPLYGSYNQLPNDTSQAPNHTAWNTFTSSLYPSEDAGHGAGASSNYMAQPETSSPVYEAATGNNAGDAVPQQALTSHQEVETPTPTYQQGVQQTYFPQASTYDSYVQQSSEHDSNGTNALYSQQEPVTSAYEYTSYSVTPGYDNTAGNRQAYDVYSSQTADNTVHNSAETVAVSDSATEAYQPTFTQQDNAALMTEQLQTPGQEIAGSEQVANVQSSTPDARGSLADAFASFVNDDEPRPKSPATRGTASDSKKPGRSRFAWLFGTPRTQNDKQQAEKAEGEPAAVTPTSERGGPSGVGTSLDAGFQGLPIDISPGEGILAYEYKEPTTSILNGSQQSGGTVHDKPRNEAQGTSDLSSWPYSTNYGAGSSSRLYENSSPAPTQRTESPLPAVALLTNNQPVLTSSPATIESSLVHPHFQGYTVGNGNTSGFEVNASAKGSPSNRQTPSFMSVGNTALQPDLAPSQTSHSNEPSQPTNTSDTQGAFSAATWGMYSYLPETQQPASNAYTSQSAGTTDTLSSTQYGSSNQKIVSPTKNLAAPYTINGYGNASENQAQSTGQDTSFFESYLDNLLRFEVPATKNEESTNQAEGEGSDTAQDKADASSSHSGDEQKQQDGGGSATQPGDDASVEVPQTTVVTQPHEAFDRGRTAAQNSNAQFKVLQQHIEDLTEEKLELSRGLAKQVELHTALQQENSTLAARLNEQAKQMEALQSKLDRYELELNAQVLAVEGMAAEREAARTAHAEANARATALAGEAVSLESQLLTAKSNVLKQQRDIEQLTAKVSKLEKQLSTRDKEQSNVNQELGRLTLEKRALFVRLKQTESRLNKLLDEGRVSGKAREQILAGLSPIKQEENDVEVQCDLLDGSVLDQLAIVTASANAASAEATTAREAQQKAQDELRSAHQQITTLKMELEQLRQQNDSHQDTHLRNDSRGVSAGPILDSDNNSSDQTGRQLALMPSMRMDMPVDRDPVSTTIAERALAAIPPATQKALAAMRDVPPALSGPVAQLGRLLPTGPLTAGSPAGTLAEAQTRALSSIHTMIAQLEEDQVAMTRQLQASLADVSKLQKENSELRHKLDLTTQLLELTLAQTAVMGGHPHTINTPTATLPNGIYDHAKSSAGVQEGVDVNNGHVHQAGSAQEQQENQQTIAAPDPASPIPHHLINPQHRGLQQHVAGTEQHAALQSSPDVPNYHNSRPYFSPQTLGTSADMYQGLPSSGGALLNKQMSEDFKNLGQHPQARSGWLGFLGLRRGAQPSKKRVRNTLI